jgi:hypothetical protein
MPARVRNDRSLPFEAVRSAILATTDGIDFIDAVLKEVREPALNKFQRFMWRVDGAVTAHALRNLKYRIPLRMRILIKNVRQRAGLKREQPREISEACGCF